MGRRAVNADLADIFRLCHKLADILHLTMTLGYQFDYQRAVDNLIGETHASGGHRVALGIAWSL